MTAKDDDYYHLVIGDTIEDGDEFFINNRWIVLAPSYCGMVIKYGTDKIRRKQKPTKKLIETLINKLEL